MTDKIFNLLQAQPVLSIVLGFVLAGFLAWVFNDIIASYIKKKYNLYSEQDIRTVGFRNINLTLSGKSDKDFLVNYLNDLTKDLEYESKN